MDNKNRIKTLLKKTDGKININSPDFSWSFFCSKGKRKINQRIYIKVNTDRQIIFGKFPLDKNDKMVDKEINILKKISVTQFFIPKVIFKTDRGFFMSAVKGIPIKMIMQKKGLSKSIEILKRAVALMAYFHQTTKIKDISFRELKNIYSKLTNKCLFEHDTQNKNLLKKISVGYMHGDFDPYNMFFDEKNKTYGLIDWENFVEKGFQELDILHFLIMTSRIFYPKEDFASLYKRIFLKNTALSRATKKILDEYCVIQKNNPDSIIKLLPIYCDVQIYRLVKTGRNPKNFLYENFKNLFQEKGYKIYP